MAAAHRMDPGQRAQPPTRTPASAVATEVSGGEDGQRAQPPTRTLRHHCLRTDLAEDAWWGGVRGAGRRRRLETAEEVGGGGRGR